VGILIRIVDVTTPEYTRERNTWNGGSSAANTQEVGADKPLRGKAGWLCEVIYMGTQPLGCREVGVKHQWWGETNRKTKRAC
jgi:hypothetical protein